MSPYSRILECFRSEGDLGTRLATISARKQLQSVFVGLRINGQRLFSSTARGIQRGSREAEAHLLPAACFAKPITATLLAKAVSQHHIDWSTEINDVLAVRSPNKGRLSGITLGHLLDHTHGLDGSTIHRAPRTSRGLLDAELLCAQLAVKPLSTPGQLYSYSNVGAWFAGALIEQLWNKPYAQLLDEHHLWGCSTDSKPLHPSSVCPATGEDLEFPVSQWLSFLDLHLRASCTDDAFSKSLASLRTTPVALPGWSPLEQGACLGWKFYGAGWFGHNAYLENSSALLRFNPEHDIAIVVETSDDAAFIALAGLFGTALPEFTNLKPLRLLNPQECSALELDRYVGTYVQAQCQLRVEVTSQAQLRLLIWTPDSSAEVAQRLLRPAEGDVFIPEPRNDPEFAFIQFVQIDPTQSFGYVWNGKQLWRRE